MMTYTPQSTSYCILCLLIRDVPSCLETSRMYSEAHNSMMLIKQRKCNTTEIYSSRTIYSSQKLFEEIYSSRRSTLSRGSTLRVVLRRSTLPRNVLR